MSDVNTDNKYEPVKNKLDLIVTSRPPIVKRALELYEFVKDCGGLVKGTTELMTQVVGLSVNSREEFYLILDELIEKDYLRVIYPNTNNSGKRNIYITLEYFYQDFLPRLRLQSPDVYELHIQYILDKKVEVESEKTIPESSHQSQPRQSRIRLSRHTS
jgi:hypothetical protein